MKTYRYDNLTVLPSFRRTTIDEQVTDLSPDGFVADTTTGDAIITRIAEADGLVLGDWDSHGLDGGERMLVWDSPEAADGDDGARAIGYITREASAKYTEDEIALEARLSAAANEEGTIQAADMLEIAPHHRPELHTTMSVSRAFFALTGKPYDADFFA